MPVIQVQNLTKYYGSTLIFSNVSFQLDPGEKVALVGANGAGKSTLLRCIAELEDYDQGEIMVSKGVRISYLAQSMEKEVLEQSLAEFMLEEYQDLIDLRKELKKLEGLMASPEVYSQREKLDKVMKEYGSTTEKYEALGGYFFESKIKEVLYGLGFREADWERPLGTFSGGQKTRLHLAKNLLREPELLLLDEPTNYLDLESVEWLEEFLQNSKGTLLVVSHDRYFLDNVATRVLELEDYTLSSYKGNYSAFVLQKTLQEAAQKKEYAKEQERIRRLEEYIRRNKAGVNARQAKSREKRLAKLGTRQRPKEHHSLSFSFQQAFDSGEEVLTVKDLTLSYPGKVLVEKINFLIGRGERIGLIGANGSGKTSFIKAILGEIPYQGSIKLGAGVKIGYFAQEHETLTKRSTVLEEIMGDSMLTVQGARELLARFQFKGDEVYKEVAALSGGEKSRLLLAKLFLSGANFLLLDEPTNHLDVYARQGLEDALAEYSGTLLFVSHDRYFLNRLADKIMEIKDGKLSIYEGNYDYYRSRKKLEEAQKAAQKMPVKKERPKAKKTVKPEVLVKKLEKEIISTEEALEQLAQTLGDSEVYNDPEQAKSLQEEYQKLEKQLEVLYQDWEEAVGQLEGG